MENWKGYLDLGGQGRSLRNPNLVGMWVLVGIGLVVLALAALLG